MTESRNHTLGKQDGIILINTRSKWFNAVLIMLCFFLLLAVRLQVNTATTGDEPHYLSMDYALVHDHSLNLKSIYVREKYLSFFPIHGLQPQGNPSIVSINSKRIYSQHGIGLPLLLFPGFLVAAKTGAVFEIVLLATFVVWLTWVWTNMVTRNRLLAYAASALLVTCYFFNGLVGYIYPDMAIAASTLIALIMLESYYKSLGHQLLLGLVLGFLVLLHIKDLSIVLPVLLVLSYKLWRTERRLPWLPFLIVAVSVAYYFITLHQWFGTWSPSQVYGSDTTSFGTGAFSNVSAMLFDSNRGLLVYNPILLLVFVGLPLWFKKNRKSFLSASVVLVPSMVMLAFFDQWFGGYAPVGRYIIDFLPALAPALAFALGALRMTWQRLFVALLAVLTFLVSLDATMSKFPLINGTLFTARPALFAQIQRHTGLSIDHLLPTYSNVTTLVNKHGLVKLAVGYVVVLAAAAYGFYLSRSVPKRRLNH